MAIQITIGATDITATGRLWYASSTAWNLVRSSRGTCSIPIILSPTDSYVPTIGQLINIYEITPGPVTTRVWAGSVDSFEIRYSVGDFGERVIIVSGVSLEQQLDTVTLDKTYTEELAGSLVADLLSLSGSSIGAGTIDVGALIDSLHVSQILSAYQTAAMDSGFIYYVDPGDGNLYFHLPTARTYARQIRSSDILWETLDWKQSRADFRDKQVIQNNATNTAVPPSTAVFPGNGLTSTFSLAVTPTTEPTFLISRSGRAGGFGTFSSNAANGDTITIGSIQYTLVSSLDNSVQYDVLIGASASATAQNLTDAINANNTQAGLTFSLPTTAHPDVEATVSTATITLLARTVGSAANAVTLTNTGAHFSFTAVTLTGGSDETSGSNVVAAGSFNVVWDGGVGITCTPDLPTGSSLIVSYFPPSLSPGVSAANNAGATTGHQSALYTLSETGTAKGAAQEAAAILATLSTLPATLVFDTLTPGYSIGRQVTLNLDLPVTAPSLLNGNWLVTEVDAQLVPGMETLGEPYGHFKYTLHLINTLDVPNFIQTLQQLTNVTKIPTSLQAQQAGNNGTQFGEVRESEARILINDTTVGTDKTQHITIITPIATLSPLTFAAVKGTRVNMVLRKAIASDLTIRFNLQSALSPLTITSWTETIPSGTAVNQLITNSTAVSAVTFHDGNILWCDVVASDGSKDSNGIAQFQVCYGEV